MRARDVREGVLDLEAILAAVASARSRRTGYERAGAFGWIATVERVANGNQHDRPTAFLSFKGRRETRVLQARLVDRSRREDEIVRVRDGVRVARSSLQGFRQTK